MQNDALGGGGSRGNGKIEFEEYQDSNLTEEIGELIKNIESKLEEKQYGNSNS